VHGVVPQQTPGDVAFQVDDGLAQLLTIAVEYVAPNQRLVVLAGGHLDPLQSEHQVVTDLEEDVDVADDNAQVSTISLLKLANHRHHLQLMPVAPPLRH